MRRGAGWVPVNASSFLLVALAAALWGSDALFRRGLALELPSGLVVFGEHLILVLLTAPLLVRGLRTARRRFGPGDWVAILLIGAGASATATVLFTAAFAYGDPNTPLLLQKVQPLIAVVGARWLLGERLHRRYPLFLVAGIAGAYLLAFPEPTQVRASALAPALLAVGAAALWGMGTVLGRRLSDRVTFGELTALRFGIGLPAAGFWVLWQGQQGALAGAGANDLGALVLLALVPGLLGLLLYYRGLRGTPATAATLGELAFPLSAVVINYVAFDAVLTASQWGGLVLLAATISLLGLASHRGQQGIGVTVPGAPARSTREAPVSA